MPIRFRCVYCGQLLSIATRKAGASVGCPKCRHINEVPEKDAPATAGRPSSASKVFEGQQVDELIAQITPVRVAPPDRESVPVPETELSDPAVGEAPEAGSESASAVDEPWTNEPEELPMTPPPDPEVAVRGARRSPPVWALVSIAVGLLLLSFALGVIVGHYAWPAREPAVKVAANDHAVVARIGSLSGRIEWQESPSHPPKADEGALVLALPAAWSPAPDERISAESVQAGDEGFQQTAELLSSHGGSLVVVGEDGHFSSPLTEEGSFCVLVVSSHAERSPSNPINASEDEMLKKYVDNLRALLRDRAFLFEKWVVRADRPVSELNYVFKSASP